MKPYYQVTNDKVVINISKRKNNYDKISAYEKIIQDSVVSSDFFETDNTIKNKKNRIEIKSVKFSY